MNASRLFSDLRRGWRSNVVLVDTSGPNDLVRESRIAAIAGKIRQESARKKRAQLFRKSLYGVATAAAAIALGLGGRSYAGRPVHRGSTQSAPR